MGTLKINLKNIIILFLGLGPVFWFANIHADIFKYIKLLLFLVVIVLIFLNSALKKTFSHNRTFVSFVLLLLFTSLFAFFQTDNIKGILKVIENYLLIFIVSWIFYNYFKDKKIDQMLTVLFQSTKIIGVLCIFIVLNHFLNLVSWKHVSQITESYAEHVKLADTGFHIGRTAWSHSLALYFIISTYAFVFYKKKIFLLFSLAIITAQFLSGGRGGLVISILVLVYYFFTKVKLKWSVLIVILFLSVISYNKDYFIKRLRLDRLEGKNHKSLVNFTAGRFGQYFFAFERLNKDYNFLKGSGFYNEENFYIKENFNKKYGRSRNIEVHLLYLKKLLEGGIFYLLTYLFFIVLFLIRTINLVLLDRKNIIYFQLLISGLITTLFEPNAIFGSLQSYFVWWASLAIVETIRINKLHA